MSAQLLKRRDKRKQRRAIPEGENQSGDSVALDPLHVSSHCLRWNHRQVPKLCRDVLSDVADHAMQTRTLSEQGVVQEKGTKRIHTKWIGAT
jgi:hypothetical protein